jgi:hypothetical protein
MKALEDGVMPSCTLTVPDVGQFVMKFPTPSDEMGQARITARYLGGLPRDSFSAGLVGAMDRDACLITCIEEYPENFPEKWKYDGFLNYPVTEVKNALYKAFSEFRKEVENRI